MSRQRWRCHECGWESPSYPSAELHAKLTGHGRIETYETTEQEQ